MKCKKVVVSMSAMVWGIEVFGSIPAFADE